MCITKLYPDIHYIFKYSYVKLIIIIMIILFSTFFLLSINIFINIYKHRINLFKKLQMLIDHLKLCFLHTQKMNI